MARAGAKAAAQRMQRLQHAALDRAHACAAAAASPPACTPRSALARAGKSVLLLDASEYYGGPWASLPGPAFSELLAARSSDHPDHQQQPEQQPPPAEAEPLPAGARLLPLALPPLGGGLAGAKVYAAADGSGPAFPRNCIIDLAPKVSMWPLLSKSLIQGDSMPLYWQLCLLTPRCQQADALHNPVWPPGHVPV